VTVADAIGCTLGTLSGNPEAKGRRHYNTPPAQPARRVMLVQTQRETA
jgi:hypothetical protein